MDDHVSMRTLIIDSIKLSVREFLHWFQLHHPDESLYAILIDVPSEGDAANILAATEEALERAVREVSKGGEADDDLRDALRWDAPGESGEPWLEPDYRWANAMTHVIRL